MEKPYTVKAHFRDISITRYDMLSGLKEAIALIEEKIGPNVASVEGGVIHIQVADETTARSLVDKINETYMCADYHYTGD